MTATDWVAILGGVSGLIIAIATLVTALRTHKAVQTSNGKSIGQLVEETNTTIVTSEPESAAHG